MCPSTFSPLGENLKNKFGCTTLGTKVAIYHFVGTLMLKSIDNLCRICVNKYLRYLITLKQKLLEVTYNCCTQNVENLFAYRTFLFACLQITAQVYSLTTSCIIWASTRENLSSGVCEQHRRRPACASAQSDQRLCYSRFVKHHIQACYEQNFDFSS